MSQDDSVVVEKPEEQPPQSPNGGIKAWLSTFAAFLLFLISWGPSTGFGAYQNYYQRDLLKDQSPSTISWIGTVNATLLISSGALAGPLFDRGYVRHLMVLGCFMAVLGEMMLSLSTTYYQIMLSQGFCSGIGSGLLYVPSIALVNTMFTTKRAVAMGIVTSGASLGMNPCSVLAGEKLTENNQGGVFFPVVFLRLQPSIGFPWTVRVLGFIQLACSILALPLLFAGVSSPKPKAPRSLIDWTAFRELPFNAYCIANFLMFMAYFIPLFYVPFYAIQALETSEDLGFGLLALVNGASAVGRLGLSVLAPKIGAPKMLPFVVFASSILLLGWIGVDNLAGFVFFCVIFGITSGVLISANPVVVAHPVISPTASVIGTRLGMQWFATSLGVLIGAPIAGALGSNGSAAAFNKLQAFSGATMFGGLLFLLIPLSVIWRYDKKKSSA